MKALLGVDIGTQGTKAALFGEDGTCLAAAFRPSALHRPGPGVVEEDPERQLDTVCAAVRECVTKARVGAGGVAGMAIAGQMAGVLGVGADGRAVTPYDSWLDTRCTPYVTRMNQVAADEIVARTGGPASFNHGPKILWWMHERRRVFRGIRAFVQPGGYAALRLCGLTAAQAFIDTSYLHFSGFADNRRRRWDPALCECFDLDARRLPRIVESAEVVGELAAPLARRCGLRAGVPVVAGCGDTAASFLACGATRAGICVDVAGTASVFAATTSEFRPDRRQRMLGVGRAATPGLWHPYAYINGGGMNLEWFREHIAGTGQPVRTAAELDRAAGALGAADDLPLFVPHLGGRVSPSWPTLRGAWVGLDWSHTAAHLWRALLEGVALEYALYREGVAGLYPELRLTEVRVTGGGQHSTLWNQLKADALETRVVQVSRAEGTPLGAALLAGYGVGLVKDLDATARQWIGLGTAFLPDRRRAVASRSRRERYRRLLTVLKDWSDIPA
jgi:xylulokinase